MVPPLGAQVEVATASHPVCRPSGYDERNIADVVRPADADFARPYHHRIIEQARSIAVRCHGHEVKEVREAFRIPSVQVGSSHARGCAGIVTHGVMTAFGESDPRVEGVVVITLTNLHTCDARVATTERGRHQACLLVEKGFEGACGNGHAAAGGCE